MNFELRDQLLSMQHEDQRVLQELIDSGELGTVEYHPRIKEVHEHNNARIKGIVKQYGWPGIGMVGKDGAEAAWLIVQHAVLDAEFMGLCLGLLEEAVRSGEAEGAHLAYLQDRVLTLSGRPQIYGTQHDVDEQGVAFPLPIENPIVVDNLRMEMGLGTLAEATNRIQERANTICRNRETDRLLSGETPGGLCVRNGDSDKGATVFQRLTEIVERSGVPFVLHEHAAARTMEDAEQNLSFDVARIVKTIAFRTRNSGIVLAALRGAGRVDYPRLAALAGVNRRDLAPLSPEEVRELLGVEPGSVSPLSLREDVALFIDEDVLEILPTIYCGIGRPDRTLEIAAADLVRLAGGRTGGFSR